MTLHELQRRLSAFNIRQEVADVIVETSPAIVKLQQGQLFLGIRSDGSEMAPYSPWYADMKAKLSDPIASKTDKRTLYLTGKFWKSIKVDVHSATFEVISNDDKSPSIMKREGNNVLGLTRDSKYQEYVPLYFTPALQERITRKLGFGFK